MPNQGTAAVGLSEQLDRQLIHLIDRKLELELIQAICTMPGHYGIAKEEGIDSGSFADEFFATAWLTMGALIAQGQIPTYPVVLKQLRSAGWGRQVDAVTWGHVPRVENVFRTLCQRVRTLHEQREALCRGIDIATDTEERAAIQQVEDPPLSELLEQLAAPRAGNENLTSPESEEADDGEPSSVFPEKAWRGIFQNYRDAMFGTTEASDVAHFATLAAAAAVALGRHVYIDSGARIYPNIYVAFFGNSGDRKTTAQRRIFSCGLLNEMPDVKILANVGSTEGLADELVNSQATSYLCIWEELSALLAHARWDGSTLFEFITQTFDCPPSWGKTYRKKSIDLKRPTPNILSAMTVEWFWKNARPDDFYGGFGNRFLFLTGEKKAPIPNPKAIPMDPVRLIQDRLKRLSRLNGEQAVWWNPEASKRWARFYRSWGKKQKTREGLLGAALRRIDVYVQKFSLIYAALEDTLPEITLEQLDAAIAVGRYAARCAEQLTDAQAVSRKPAVELEQRFVNWVKEHNGERLRTMQQRMWKYCGGAQTFNAVLNDLVKAKLIKVSIEKTSIGRRECVFYVD